MCCVLERNGRSKMNRWGCGQGSRACSQGMGAKEPGAERVAATFQADESAAAGRMRPWRSSLCLPVLFYHVSLSFVNILCKSLIPADRMSTGTSTGSLLSAHGQAV